MSEPVRNVAIDNLIAARPAAAPNRAQKAGEDFSRILENRLKLSGHAQTRLQSRNIELGRQEWDRVI